MGYHENPPYYLTAYDLAMKWGFRGTEQDWLTSLTAYYFAQQAGYKGTIQDWIAVLADPVPNIQIGEVVTLEGGSKATASFSGDKRNPLLNLGIPRGVGQADALPFVGGTMKGDINMNGNYLTGLPEPSENGQAAPKSYVDKMLPLSGGTMTGALNVQAPTANSHAVNKKYADEIKETVKKYADDKHLKFTVAVPAEGWDGEEAPYTQTVAVAGILKTDTPHWDVVYSDDLDTAIQEKDGFSAVDDLETAADAVTFICLEDVPTVDLTVHLEVNR